VTSIVIALEVPSRAVLQAILIAFVIGVVLAILLALALTNEAWMRLGDSSGVNIEAGVRPLAFAVVILAVIGALLGLVWGVRRGGIKGGVAGIVIGTILAAIVGAASAIRFGTGPGVATGIAIGFGMWIALAIGAFRRHPFDAQKFAARFVPRQTIDTTKETIEWVRERTPLGPQQ